MVNKSWLSAIKVIIFDMDGTLYQEDTFLERYIHYLLGETPHEGETEMAILVGRAILAGEHPFKMGYFYHMVDDVVLVRHEDSFVQGFTWEGNAMDELARAYGPFSSQTDHLIHIGDPWCIAAAISHRFQLSKEKSSSALERIREEMVLPPFQFEFRADLFQVIGELTAVEKKILMTNSDLKSGIQFLEYMGIYELFDEVHCGAEKPLGLNSYLKSLMEQGYQAHEILSIGDNPWNDLHPVKRMGGRTCFISPYSNSDPEAWDLRLTTLDELKLLMREIQKSIIRRRTSNGEDRVEKYKQEIQG